MHIFLHLQLYICSLTRLLFDLVDALLMEFKEGFGYQNFALEHPVFVGEKPLLLASKPNDDDSLFNRQFKIGL